MTEAQDNGIRVGAIVIPMAPEGIVLIEKPGKGRGLEFPGGHGKPEDMSPAEVGERELLEETGIRVNPDDLRIVGEPRVTHTHTSYAFLAQLEKLPKTLKSVGEDGEIIYVLRMKELQLMRRRIFPPHLPHLDAALKMLDTSRCHKN